MLALIPAALLAATSLALVEPNVSATTDPVIAAAGDIACAPSSSKTSSRCHQAETAKLLSTATKVLTLGDNQYQSGTAYEYASSYDSTWGVRKSVTAPVPGNHDYYTSGASGYFGYFGVQPYYSYNLGAWHLVALNSNLSVAEGSTQNNWLESDLAANTAKCTLTYFHHPRYTAGKYSPGITTMKPLWVDMLADRVDLTLSGHDHNYQRWAPMNNYGGTAYAGVRQFIVGTGGASHYGLTTRPTGLQASSDSTFGVLRLTLHPTSYDWAYVTEAGATIDSGTAPCR
jgi:hypothetical protein